MAYKNKEDQLRCQREWYGRNKEERKKQIFKRRKALKIWVDEYKSKIKCSRCPERDPVCIEFHHKGDKKIDCISMMINRGFSKEKILKEIKKCIPLCANCHKKEHFGKKKS